MPASSFSILKDKKEKLKKKKELLATTQHDDDDGDDDGTERSARRNQCECECEEEEERDALLNEWTLHHSKPTQHCGCRTAWSRS